MTIRDIFHANGLNYSQIVGDELTTVSMELQDFNYSLEQINAYILGEVMELLEDEPYEAKARTIKHPIPEGAKYLQVPVVGIEKFVYQELRNKANKKFGGK